MRYISLLLLFLPQQNQLSRQRRKRGSLGGSSLGQDLRRPGLLERNHMERDRQQKRWGRSKEEVREEEGGGTFKERRREKRWDIHWICINRSWTGRRAREWTAAAADKAIQACQNPAARPVIYEDPQSRLRSKSSIQQPFVQPPTRAHTSALEPDWYWIFEIWDINFWE